MMGTLLGSREWRSLLHNFRRGTFSIIYANWSLDSLISFLFPAFLFSLIWIHLANLRMKVKLIVLLYLCTACNPPRSFAEPHLCRPIESDPIHSGIYNIDWLEEPPQTKASILIMVEERKKGYFSRDCDSKRVSSVALYRPKLTATNDAKKKRSTPKAFHFVFLVIYLFQGYRCIRTIGSEFIAWELKYGAQAGFQTNLFYLFQNLMKNFCWEPKEMDFRVSERNLLFV